MDKGYLIMVQHVLDRLGYEVVTGSDITKFDFLYTRYLMYYPSGQSFPTAQRWTPDIMVRKHNQEY